PRPIKGDRSELHSRPAALRMSCKHLLSEQGAFFLAESSTEQHIQAQPPDWMSVGEWIPRDNWVSARLFCILGNTKLIFPSCLTLKGLELGISQLKNEEAVKEENKLIFYKWEPDLQDPSPWTILLKIIKVSIYGCPREGKTTATP
ncbi:hypothetical protein EK904_008412, partial [Melospiza melodia maxima]